MATRSHCTRRVEWRAAGDSVDRPSRRSDSSCATAGPAHRSVWYCRELVDKIAKRTGRLDRPGQPEHGRSFTAYALARGGIRTTVMEPTPPEVRGRPSGRPRLVRREYERLARECRRLLLAGRQGRSLYRELARRLNLTASQVKDRLSRGRRYGYFPDLPTRGRSG